MHKYSHACVHAYRKDLAFSHIPIHILWIPFSLTLTHTHTHSHSHILCSRFSVSRQLTVFSVCLSQAISLLFFGGLHAQNFPISLLNTAMFNRIIIAYFIPLADGKSSWSVPQFLCLRVCSWCKLKFVSFYYLFWPNKSNCICWEEHHQHQIDIH